MGFFYIQFTIGLNGGYLEQKEQKALISEIPIDVGSDVVSLKMWRGNQGNICRN